MLDVSVLYTLLFCALLLILAKKRKGSTLRYPPGPKGYPILGNVLDLPPSIPLCEALTSLTNRQGTDILYLRLLNDDVIVLSSNGAISELLEKRSGIYADRPQTTMLEMSGTTEWAMVSMSYGDKWRARRKLCHEVLNVRLTAKFDDHQYKYTYQLLSRLLDAPESFMEEVGFMPGAVIMSVTYGIDAKSTNDPFLSAMMEANNAFKPLVVPGNFLADTIPILRHIPDWFPGAGFKVLAKELRDKLKISVDGPMEYVKNAMKSGEKFSQSITSDCLSRLEDHKKIDFDEGVIRDVSGAMYGAATETTKSLLHTFFLAIVLNPEARKKAQEELDRVVGKNRLPEFSDKENLPYIDALMKELLRWSPPLPLSIPTRVTQDDVYRGYVIPEGATVIQNVWAVFRDPSIYPDPETFNPDRFLKDGKINPLVLNPEDRAFGAGRRICPGRHFALRTAYLVITCVLSVFNVEPTLDDDGNPQVPKAGYEGTIIQYVP